MGTGINVKCTKCNYNSELLSDYGGIFDYFTYECKDCRRFFNILREHQNQNTENEASTVEEWLKNMSAEKYPDHPLEGIVCDHCNGTNVVPITYWKDGTIKLDENNVTCPKCNGRLVVEGIIYFDD